MVILAIETSCDETAVSVIDVTGNFPNANFEVLGDALLSQAEIHREYGGVFPNVAKREHALALIPLLEKALAEAHLNALPHAALFPEQKEALEELLRRETGLAQALFDFYENYNTPEVDLIAVTHGPGLEPALWVGVNFAKALSRIWNVPVIGVNHMEGHILSSIFDGSALADITFPAVALLISGGHTELVLMRQWGVYERIGETRDDAIGEAFDKVARMLGLPYPGGPEISKLAERARTEGIESPVKLPRPMINSGNLDFSFSGLKTAVLYATKDKTLTDNEKAGIAREFEDAAAAVLLAKAKQAVETYGAETLILGGGVTANTHVRRVFETEIKEHMPNVSLHIPSRKLSTDNAVMIALAATAQYATHGALKNDQLDALTANGNLSISTQL